MSDDRHLTFVVKTIKEKIKYRDNSSTCPFCNRDELTNIIAQDGPIILLENKFPSLADTYQLVLIETERCGEDISTYSKAHLQRVLRFGIKHWFELEASGKYKSVVFFKNHGFLSGGSVDHAHMQIVGLKNIDYKEKITDDIFKGIEIVREGDSSITVSTLPNACSTEVNIITPHRDGIFISDYLQIIVRYLLKQCSSYNLFFYKWNDSIICKAVSRWVTSPFVVGYNIPHSTDRVNVMAEELGRLCRDVDRKSC